MTRRIAHIISITTGTLGIVYGSMMCFWELSFDTSSLRGYLTQLRFAGRVARKTLGRRGLCTWSVPFSVPPSFPLLLFYLARRNLPSIRSVVSEALTYHTNPLHLPKPVVSDSVTPPTKMQRVTDCPQSNIHNIPNLISLVAGNFSASSSPIGILLVAEVLSQLNIRRSGFSNCLAL